MQAGYREPLYTIGIVARKLGVSIPTLRIWEKKGLIKPARIGKNRFYSQWDIDRLVRIKELLQKEHINIEGAKKIINALRCWEIKSCPPKTKNSCLVFRKSR